MKKNKIKTKKKSKKKKRNRKLKKGPKLVLLLLFLLSLLIILKKSLDNYDIIFNNTYDYLKNKIDNQKTKQEEKKQQEENYNQCLVQKFTEDERTDELTEAENELSNYLAEYNLSVKFIDINTDYSYQSNEQKVYYAASTIKMLDALYIYKNAESGKIDLEETKKYTKNFKVLYSTGLEKHKIGDNISLRNLVKYAITVSDNSAHQMLIDYIGFKNLQQYGNDLGAKNTLIGVDNFGQIDVNDSIIYLKELYKFIKTNSELAIELKSYFTASDENFLKDEENNIEAATKYGEYGNIFHNNGIVFRQNPYLISVLTNLGKKKGSEIIKNINKKVQELQDEVYLNRQNYCQQKFYTNDSD